MDKLLLIGAALVLVVLIALFVLGYRSQAGAPPGLVDGRLAPCPDTPNCVNSEYEADAEHYIEPLRFAADEADGVLARLQAVIGEMGGVVKTESGDYLAVTFTSSIFRFVDDLELRIDASENKVHLRSASRVGRSDLGANRKRLQHLQALFLAKAN